MLTPAKKLAGLIVLFLFSHFSNLYSQATNLHVFQEWVDKNGLSGAPDIVKKIKSKSGNFLYTLTSTVNSSGNYDWLLNKYNNTGALIWSSQYDGAAGTNDYGLDVFIYSNRLFVTGTVTVDTAQGYDLGVAEFNDTTGALEWITTYDNGQSYPYYNDGGIGIVVGQDQSNIIATPYIFVTGGTPDPSRLTDYLTQCYDLSGNLQWTQTYDHNSLDDISADVTFDGYSVVVSGIVQRDPYNNAGLAIEYDISGNYVSSTQPSPAYDDTITQVHDIAFYPNGDIYIVGQLYNPSSGKNTKIVKLDSTLNVQWEYSSSLTGDDEGNFIMLDSSGHVYAGGYLTAGGNKDYMLMKFDTAGNLIWGPITYDGPANGEDVAEAGVLDYNGEILITGYSEIDSLNFDYYTMKYDTAGNVLWEINYNGLANKNDKASEIALDNSGNIYVIGQSQDSSGINSRYVTVKYVEHELFNVSDDDSIPSSFNIVPNWGQLLNMDTIINVNTSVKLYSSGPSVFFENNRLIHVFSSLDSTLIAMDTIIRVNMTFSNDTNKRVYPQNKRDWNINYYTEQTMLTNGLCNVPVYKEVVYPEIYRFIDLHISANSSGIIERFVVKPIGDPEDISFVYEGVDTIYVDGSGNLVIETMLDEIVYIRPSCTQIDSSGVFVPIAWQPIYRVSGDTISFDSIQSYNINLPLVIEMHQYAPMLLTGTSEWSSFFGASRDEIAYDIASDPVGNIYVVEETGSNIDFPLFLAYQGTFGAGFSMLLLQNLMIITIGNGLHIMEEQVSSMVMELHMMKQTIQFIFVV